MHKHSTSPLTSPLNETASLVASIVTRDKKADDGMMKSDPTEIRVHLRIFKAAEDCFTPCTEITMDDQETRNLLRFLSTFFTRSTD